MAETTTKLGITTVQCNHFGPVWKDPGSWLGPGDKRATPAERYLDREEWRVAPPGGRLSGGPVPSPNQPAREERHVDRLGCSAVDHRRPRPRYPLPGGTGSGHTSCGSRSARSASHDCEAIASEGGAKDPCKTGEREELS